MSCLYPHTIRNPRTRKFVTVSCRKCHNCRLQRQSDLEFQCLMSLLQGYKYGTGAAFVTLTYNNDNVPLVLNEDGKYYYSLKKSDFNNFWVKVRSFYRSKNMYVPQFCACGEYGDSTERPHYHILVFGSNNLEFSSIAKMCWKSKNGVKGLIDSRPLRQGAIRYVIDYILKEDDKTFKSSYDDLGLERPFLRHSTRLGLDYFFNDFEYDPSDFTYIRNGKRCLIPATYRKKLPGGDGFIYEDIKGINNSYEEGIPYEVYSMRNALDNAELDIFRKRQKSSPVNNLPHTLKNYIFTTVEHYNKNKFIRECVEDTLQKMGLPTDKEFYRSEDFLLNISDENLKKIAPLIAKLR